MEHHNCIAEAVKAIGWFEISIFGFFSIAAYSFCKALGGGWEKK